MIERFILGFFLIVAGALTLGYAMGAFPVGTFPLTGQGVACCIVFYAAPGGCIAMGVISFLDACAITIDTPQGY